MRHEICFAKFRELARFITTCLQTIIQRFSMYCRTPRTRDALDTIFLKQSKYITDVHSTDAIGKDFTLPLYSRSRLKLTFFFFWNKSNFDRCWNNICHCHIAWFVYVYLQQFLHSSKFSTLVRAPYLFLSGPNPSPVSHISIHLRFAHCQSHIHHSVINLSW